MVRYYSIIVPLILIFLVFGISFGHLRDSHGKYEERAILNAQNMGIMMAEETRAYFRPIDVTLLAAVDQIQLNIGKEKLDNLFLDRQLYTLERRVPGLNLLKYADASGNVLSGGNISMNVANTEYFKGLQSGANFNMAISGPLRDPDTNEWFLVCARRYVLPDGKFGGVVFATLKTDRIISQLFGSMLQISSRDILLILNSEFATLGAFFNGRESREIIGKKMAFDDFVGSKNLTSSPNVKITYTVFDQNKRFTYFNQIPKLPFYVVVGLNAEDVFSPWWKEVIFIFFIDLLLAALISFIFFSHYRSHRKKISEQEKYQNDLQYQAMHDPLTKLPNRLLLLDRINSVIQLAYQDKFKVAVFFINLDKFKTINDSLGREYGDQVLREIALRLSDIIRDPDIIGRLGSDEFLAVCQIKQNDNSNLNAQRVLECLRTPLQLGGSTQVLGGSVGISVYPEDGDNAEILLKSAELAMHCAKKSEQNNKVHYYLREMQSEAEDRMLLEKRLREAIPNNELVLYYQPQVDLRSGTLTGFEALIRWNSPVYGLLPPGRFIPIAEETDIIKAIGYWVLYTACKQIRDWHELGYEWLSVAINMSAAEFCNGETVVYIEDAIKKYNIPAFCLEVELTESLSLNDPEASIETMHKLKKLGVRLAIDDFGVGYSNLGYLKLFPADCLKIDQVFTRGLCHNPEDRAIVNTVIQLAHSLSMVALAEGAETESEARQLCALGADRVQGYWIARPVPPEDVIPMLQKARMFDPKLLMPTSERLKVLVVDDSSTMREFLVEGLADLIPVEFLCAEDANEAMSIILSHQLFAIIADNYLPGQSGVELLAQARKISPAVLRILITGTPNTQLLREAINFAGVEHFLSKPVDLDHLLDILKKAMLREVSVVI
ncbi:EAL domain-containing protein [Undibacterium jejuense]|uniref:EAL domain-containing protein n=1 Tax=Undibacterium jejuense TaxID=1344949 RepID=A0A923HP39_9BURK|nr:EAL domain-containing protein [Undibacterium jejuense]MBC3863121.1 EAL domain-containing protein [Undibacterium jejuense]